MRLDNIPKEDIEKLAKYMFKILADYYGAFEESWEETREKPFWRRKAKLILNKLEEDKKCA